MKQLPQLRFFVPQKLAKMDTLLYIVMSLSNLVFFCSDMDETSVRNSEVPCRAHHRSWTRPLDPKLVQFFAGLVSQAELAEVVFWPSTLQPDSPHGSGELPQLVVSLQW